MLTKITSYSLFLMLLGGFLMVGCSKSDDQRKFENEALATPQNITETKNDGTVINIDEDDWRISPMYQGQISIGLQNDEPPFPNPVLFNSNLTIQLYFRTDSPVNALDIRRFRYPNSDVFTQVDFIPQDQLNAYNNITIPASQIAIGEGSSASGLYRLLIYDGNQNLITYGDIEVQ
ncbi:MAG: hypothetical protein PVH63_09850 [Balneolaceae bacterium]|jgi:hypothetical protein